MLDALLVFVGSYLVGSIPVAYLIVRQRAKINISATGSGNAGGFNAYIVTNSKTVGFIVGFLDALKGLVPVLVAVYLFPGSYVKQVVALFGAIGGHNYPIWTRFKGGRGLSTSAGGMFYLGFSYTIVWCIVWVVVKLIRRDILIANLAAIFMTPMILWITPWSWVNRLVVVQVDSGTFLFFSCLLSAVLCLSHLDVLREVWTGVKATPDNL